MTNSPNKVEFGISDLYVGTYTDSGGTITLGTPYHQKGAISFSPEENSESTKFYADNILYWTGFTGGTFEGDLEVAKFDDQFKQDFLGYIVKTDGGIGLAKNPTKPDVYIMLETQGNSEPRRVIFYNCQLGGITRSYETIEETTEPTTETLSVTVSGDNTTGLSYVSYTESATGYATLFTNPPVPSLT